MGAAGVTQVPYGPYAEERRDGTHGLSDEGRRELESFLAQWPTPGKLLHKAHRGLWCTAVARLGLDETNAICSEGMLKAMLHYDPSLGFAFSTYAASWCRAYIGRALLKEDAADRYGVVIQEDRPVGADKDATVLGLFGARDDTAMAAQSADERRMLKREVAKILKRLHFREREILMLRHGLHGGDPMTLMAIGELFGVSRSVIDQRERKAMEKIRPALEKLFRQHLAA